MSDVPAQEVPDSVVQRLVDPRMIDELFNMDPLKLTDANLDVIIAELRKDRAEHLLAAAQPKGKKTSSAKQATIPLGDIDLSDLGL